MFDECHTPLIFREYAPQYLIGELQLSEHSDSPVLVDAEPAPALADAPVEPYGELASPFPAERFDGSGVEAFRFQWSARDWLLRRDPSTGQSRAPTREEMAHVHRAKSHVAPLDYERDWLHVSHPAAYAADMVLKEALLSDPEPRRMCYVTTPESNAAEQEVLDDVMGWVTARYPERFTLDHATGTISTHTQGYERCFTIAEFAAEPLRLAGMVSAEHAARFDAPAARCLTQTVPANSWSRKTST